MIFMSQSGLTDQAREAQWDAWYVEHLRLMRSVPGFRSAQRFRTNSSDYSPSLAMYTVDSEDVFKDPYYLSVRGMGEWASLIDRRHYHRNLFHSEVAAPTVPADGILIVADRNEPDAILEGMTWLRAVAIDLSTPYRGIRSITRPGLSCWNGHEGVAVYYPVS